MLAANVKANLTISNTTQLTFVGADNASHYGEAQFKSALCICTR